MAAYAPRRAARKEPVGRETGPRETRAKLAAERAQAERAEQLQLQSDAATAVQSRVRSKQAKAAVARRRRELASLEQESFRKVDQGSSSSIDLTDQGADAPAAADAHATSAPKPRSKQLLKSMARLSLAASVLRSAVPRVNTEIGVSENGALSLSFDVEEPPE